MKLRLLLLCVIVGILSLPIHLYSQNRDLQSERLVLDDNAGDGLLNRMTIQTPNPLPQNVLLTIPDPGAGTAEILLGPSGSGGAWFLGGNAGTTPGTHFIGTTDNQAFHIRVNNINRMILNSNGSIQRDAGGAPRGTNAIDLQNIRSAVNQVASGSSSVVSGGFANRASGAQTSIGGGWGNTAGGIYSAVVGGQSNSALATLSTIGGGRLNTIEPSGGYSTISGGYRNTITGDRGAIAGGDSNTIAGNRSAIAGGDNNTITGNLSAIAGGRGLTLNGRYSFGFLSAVGTGITKDYMIINDSNVVVFGNTDLWLANNTNSASQLRFYEANNSTGAFPNGTNYTAFVAGVQAADIVYTLPTAAPSADGQILTSTTGGTMSWADPAPAGWELAGNAGTTPGTHFIGTTDSLAFHIRANNIDRMIFNPNGSIQRDAGGNRRGTGAVDFQIMRANDTMVVSGLRSFLGGGQNNTVSGDLATIGGGASNIASNSGSTVAGGQINKALAPSATVGGGLLNTAEVPQSTVAGGARNTAAGVASTVSGGRRNAASGDLSAIAGGMGLTLNEGYSFGFLGGAATAADYMIINDSNVVVFGNTNLWLANNENSASQLRFYEANNSTGAFPNGTNYTAFVAGVQAADIVYTLPTAAPSADGQILTSTTGGAMSWTGDAELSSLQLNGATPVTNSRIVVNEGHWTSQGTAPTAAGDGTNLAAGVTVAGTSTDVTGRVTATDGGAIGTGVVTVTFDAAYTSDPIVSITPANATAAGSTFYVSNTTTTTFDINISTTSGNGTDTYVFNYIVVEAD